MKSLPKNQGELSHIGHKNIIFNKVTISNSKQGTTVENQRITIISLTGSL